MAFRNPASLVHPGKRVLDHMSGGEGQRTEQHTRRVANCNTLIATGNCSSDNFWPMPDDQWWNYPGIGGTASNRSKGTILTQNPGNPSGFDFVGGQTTSETAVTTVNGRRVVSAMADLYSRPHVKVREETVNNCNCGPSTVTVAGDQVNCYSNCNCACVCVCVCVCDCVCFPEGTQVTMADGNQQGIETIQVGDKVLGAFGYINEVRVTENAPIGSYSAWLINDTYWVAGGHRMWSVDRGWVAAKPADWYESNAKPSVKAVLEEVHGRPWDVLIDTAKDRLPKQMRVGDTLAYGEDDSIEIETLVELPNDPDLVLYELGCANGSSSYTVYGGLWAIAMANNDFDFNSQIKTKDNDGKTLDVAL